MGKPLAAQDSQPLIHDSRTGRTFASPTVGSQQRAVDAALRQGDRGQRPEVVVEPVRVGIYPGHAIGRAWLDLDSTAEAP